MDYSYLKKYLGENRLRRELEFIENREWLDPRRKKEAWLGNVVLKFVDELIRKNESIINFQKWAKEATESKNLKDCLFELICVDMLSKYNKIIIKQKNGKKVPDAFIESEKIYIEMTNLENVPISIELKVNDLCKKSQDRFGNSLGIHLVGINGFFEYGREEDKLIPKKELSVLVEDLRAKIQQLNKNMLCFILIHNSVIYHPNIAQVRLYVKVPHVIFNGVSNWNLLKKLIGETSS